jgi:hypothetical protein
MFSSSIFTVAGLMFKSFYVGLCPRIFELTLHVKRSKDLMSSFHMWISSFPSHLLKFVLSPLCVLSTSVPFPLNLRIWLSTFIKSLIKF